MSRAVGPAGAWICLFVFVWGVCVCHLVCPVSVRLLCLSQGRADARRNGERRGGTDRTRESLLRRRRTVEGRSFEPECGEFPV